MNFLRRVNNNIRLNVELIRNRLGRLVIDKNIGNVVVNSLIRKGSYSILNVSS